LLGECVSVPLGDLAALRERLERRDVAALIVEPGQGKGVYLPSDDFLQQAQRLCRETGTLLIYNEVQTGMGRTGRWWGFEHWGLEPDIVTVAKALSGGYVPCAAVVTRRAIYQRTFSRLDRCVVHSSTFGRNNLAMACGLATLQVLDEEGLVENARVGGAELRQRLEVLQARHSVIQEVRGLGLMLAIEFREPDEFASRMGWKLLRRVEPGLFAQMVVTSLCTKHRILTQLAGHSMNVLKILPPLMIGEADPAADDRRSGDRALCRGARCGAHGLPALPRSDLGFRREPRETLAPAGAGEDGGRALSRGVRELAAALHGYHWRGSSSCSGPPERRRTSACLSLRWVERRRLPSLRARM
jgi:acetylornithine/succinyldiaminopimelate/putrescine aminotransferase